MVLIVYNEQCGGRRIPAELGRVENGYGWQKQAVPILEAPHNGPYASRQRDSRVHRSTYHHGYPR